VGGFQDAHLIDSLELKTQAQIKPHFEVRTIVSVTQEMKVHRNGIQIRDEPQGTSLRVLVRPKGSYRSTLLDVETITDAEIAHLKKLARLEMSESETALAKRDINKILESFTALQKLDLDGLPEMPRPVPLVNIMREDQVQPGFTQAQAMSVAVDAEDGFFKVPRIVE
jgi:aspartyl-tRNA(Asn)/glutamyl-tRNA(Gln) amidotransferase subunit C